MPAGEEAVDMMQCKPCMRTNGRVAPEWTVKRTGEAGPDMRHGAQARCRSSQSRLDNLRKFAFFRGENVVLSE